MAEPTAHTPPYPAGCANPADLMVQVSQQLTRSLVRLAEGPPRPPLPPRTPRPPLPARTPAAPETPCPSRPPLVAVAHGSRDPRALRTVQALLERIRALRPGLDVRLGHIELNEPLLAGTLALLAGGLAAPEGHAIPAPVSPEAPAVLVPLLLGRGHHVKHDLPAALAAAPRVRGVVADPLGPHPLLAEALHVRLVEAGWGRPLPGEAVVLAAAGSRDPDSAADTAATAALLSARLGGVPVVPAFASAASPTVPEALAALAARGVRRVAVAACFTAPGRFAAQTAAAAPWIAAAPLGAQDAMARLVLHRYDRAAASLAAGPARPLAAATRN
ncbi:sirohydrochlorin chelatase [Streptomyces sp. NPDC020917]|uniref:sirohydrochlorin chelatase n=1 Tax=Streptomyces sp. NPDC020917 TaxID=3365102 RepID=UPI0037A510EB